MLTSKIGMVGTGYFSKFHTEMLMKIPDVELAAICGTSIEKAERMTEEIPDARAYDDIVTMLDAEQLDAVYICVPPMKHGEIELELVKRGIPFLVEKPLGNELEIPTEILKGIKEKSLITSVGYHHRYSDSITTLKNELNGQYIGMVLGQFSTSMPTVSWWRDQASSGGQFLEQTTHIVDLLRFFCGEVEEVQAVYANNTLAVKDSSVTVADVGTVTLKLRNGAIANLSNTCILPAGIEKIGLTFYTDKGLYEWTPGRLEMSTAAGKFEILDQANPYQLENEAFIHAVRTGDQSRILSSYEDSFKTHQVTYASLQSAQKNRPVSL